MHQQLNNRRDTQVAFIEFAEAGSAVTALLCSGQLIGQRQVRVSASKTQLKLNAKTARRSMTSSREGRYTKLAVGGEENREDGDGHKDGAGYDEGSSGPSLSGSKGKEAEGGVEDGEGGEVLTEAVLSSIGKLSVQDDPSIETAVA